LKTVESYLIEAVADKLFYGDIGVAPQ
jgi:hypothetical protein